MKNAWAAPILVDLVPAEEADKGAAAIYDGIGLDIPPS